VRSIRLGALGTSLGTAFSVQAPDATAPAHCHLVEDQAAAGSDFFSPEIPRLKEGLEGHALIRPEGKIHRVDPKFAS
jgi:hypothetical protein